MPERLAVIVSTYNAPDFLRLALAAYGRQSDRSFCIYIADDGSDEETRRVIDTFRRSSPIPVHHIRHEDEGFRKARIHNLVLKQVQEPYILLTDGDCIPLPDLVAAHRSLARRGTFISGSRVLLAPGISQALCRDGVSLPTSAAAWLGWRLGGRINRILPLLGPQRLSSPVSSLRGIRGCHLSCWHADLVTVNGFDETYRGWGREDSDLAARLMHAGCRRRNLRGLPVLHLWHPESPRHHLTANDELLRECMDQRRIRARIGLAELREP